MAHVLHALTERKRRDGERQSFSSPLSSSPRLLSSPLPRSSSPSSAKDRGWLNRAENSPRAQTARDGRGAIDRGIGGWTTHRLDESVRRELSTDTTKCAASSTKDKASSTNSSIKDNNDPFLSVLNLSASIWPWAEEDPRPVARSERDGPLPVLASKIKGPLPDILDSDLQLKLEGERRYRRQCQKFAMPALAMTRLWCRQEEAKWKEKLDAASIVILQLQEENGRLKQAVQEAQSLQVEKVAAVQVSTLPAAVLLLMSVLKLLFQVECNNKLREVKQSSRKVEKEWEAAIAIKDKEIEESKIEIASLLRQRDEEKLQVSWRVWLVKIGAEMLEKEGKNAERSKQSDTKAQTKLMEQALIDRERELRVLQANSASEIENLHFQVHGQLEYNQELKKRVESLQQQNFRLSNEMHDEKEKMINLQTEVTRFVACHTSRSPPATAGYLEDQDKLVEIRLQGCVGEDENDGKHCALVGRGSRRHVRESRRQREKASARYGRLVEMFGGSEARAAVSLVEPERRYVQRGEMWRDLKQDDGIVMMKIARSHSTTRHYDIYRHSSYDPPLLLVLLSFLSLCSPLSTSTTACRIMFCQRDIHDLTKQVTWLMMQILNEDAIEGADKSSSLGNMIEIGNVDLDLSCGEEIMHDLHSFRILTSLQCSVIEFVPLANS
eukprot:768441-Hanusia_phi.AAC.2